MKFKIISIGKKHDKYLEDFNSDFEKRIKINFDISWSIIPSFDDNNKEIQIKKESEKILNILEKENNSFVILLDEDGKQKINTELANIFQDNMNNSVDKIIFIVGGAFGVNNELKNKSNLILSLSKLVFPHQLVRAILIEQIYRSITILKNGKYHHE